LKKRLSLILSVMLLTVFLLPLPALAGVAPKTPGTL
jgi:hypothetical protein